ncbi:MTH1187 family thiamine-binding protein [bacterium]|nr:MTH1187 family thiamine-binding protein [candidate division CSSED10-310 bacterium]
MLMQFSTFPVGAGDHLSAEVSQVIAAVEQSGLPYTLSAMSTVVEGEWDELMALAKRCHLLLRAANARVYTVISIDDRHDARDRLHGKVRSIEEKLGRTLSTS